MSRQLIPHNQYEPGVSVFIDRQFPLTFQKFALCHFAFRDDLHQHHYSLNKRNPRTIFPFRKKGDEQSQGSAFVSQGALQRRQHPEQLEWPPKLLPQKLHSASSPKALNCVSGHLCCISMYVCASVSKMCPKASEKPKKAHKSVNPYHKTGHH